FQSLQTATYLASRRNGGIALIDSEGGSSNIYGDDFDFDVMDLGGNHSPREYVNGIKTAVDDGYAVLVIDSFSHAWNGAGGVLEIVDKAGARYRDNKWAGWFEGRPAQNQLIQAILNADIDIIVTMRAKTEWLLEVNPSTNKSTPVAIGTSAVQ